MSMGERVRQARLAQGLSQEDLAAQLIEQGYSITKGAISQYERNQRVPTGRIIMALARNLQVSNEYFFADPHVSITWASQRSRVEE